MFRITLFTVFYLLISVIRAQDTIRFVDNTLEIAKILEVGLEEVKFKRFLNPGGPTYIRNKSEINYIRLSDGTVEQIMGRYEKKYSKPYDAFANLSTIDTIGNFMYYKGRELNEAGLTRLVRAYPNTTGHIKLMMLHSEMKKNKRKQINSMFILPGIGAYSLMMSIFLSEEFDQPLPVITVGGVIALSTCIAAGYRYDLFKKRRYQKQKELVALYNTHPQ